MSDLIDRQAAIDALEKVADMFPWRVPGNRDTYDRYNEAWNDAIGRAEMEIENMTPAQPGWIPCSSALPEHDENVLICAKNYEDCKWYEELTARVCDCIPGETSTQVLEFGCKHGACGDCDMESQKPYWLHILVGWFSDGEWDGNGLTDGEEVVAWMELPKPWEGGQK